MSRLFDSNSTYLINYFFNLICLCMFKLTTDVLYFIYLLLVLLIVVIEAFLINESIVGLYISWKCYIALMAAVISHFIFRRQIRFQLRVTIEQVLNSFSANLIMHHFFSLPLIMNLITLIYWVISIIYVFRYPVHVELLLDLTQYLFLLFLQVPYHLIFHIRIIRQVVGDISLFHWTSTGFNKWSKVLSPLDLFKNFIFIHKTKIRFSSRLCDNKWFFWVIHWLSKLNW
jgi:hypothetical protein